MRTWVRRFPFAVEHNRANIHAELFENQVDKTNNNIIDCEEIERVVDFLEAFVLEGLSCAHYREE